MNTTCINTNFAVLATAYSLRKVSYHLTKIHRMWVLLFLDAEQTVKSTMQ